MNEDLITEAVNDEGLLSYLRYNFLLDTETLNQLKPNGKTFNKKQVDDLIEMSNAASRFDLYDIGIAAATNEVSEDHFPEKFSLKINV